MGSCNYTGGCGIYKYPHIKEFKRRAGLAHRQTASGNKQYAVS